MLAAASLDKRPEEEMYDIQRDPYCLTNLAEKQELQQIKSELSESLRKELQETGDPRVSGYGDVWESYPRYSSMRKFSGFKTRGVYNSKFQLPQD